VDPVLPVKTETMQHRVSALTGRPRFLAALLGLFAAFGLALAAIGLYGVLSFLVAQRTREIGVRMAMGATPANIAGMVERQAGLWVLSGLAAGLTAAIALAGVARSALFEVSPYDGASLAVAVALLALVAALAAWRPARRPGSLATRRVTALRSRVYVCTCKRGLSFSAPPRLNGIGESRLDFICAAILYSISNARPGIPPD
jgi:ABC-type lipoprotein release transport system permease subunit